MSEQRTDIEQLWFKYRKALVAQIRMKYTLLAEDELNQALHAAKRAFDKQVQQGVMPAPPTVMGALSA